MVKIDRSRDDKLSEFGKATLKDRYLLEGEDYQDMFARVADTYGDDEEHSQRLYDYMSNMWFMPATPILSNGGTDRGLPVSCYLNETGDSLEGIVDLWVENVWLASNGGGIGSYWGNIRGIGEKVGKRGTTSGNIPFIKVQDSLTLAISQGSLRRGSSAVYLDVSHPEIEEFIEIRRPTGGDPNRKSLNIHHGVTIPDAFMEAVEKGESWNLVSPKDGSVRETVDARDIWMRILTARIETGEPYIIFSDAVNRAIPEHHKALGLDVKMSNLCTEITLPTTSDRTAICCLSSLNLEKWDEWEHHQTFIYDVMSMLDNVLSDFIQKAPDQMKRARYSALRERSVGLGVMGFHSFLQSKGVPFESAIAQSWNNKIFKHIKRYADSANEQLGYERGSCKDVWDAGGKTYRRFSNCTAIAPTASISGICGNSSPGIEPYAANAFTQKTLSGSFSIRNKHLAQILSQKSGGDVEWYEEKFGEIARNEGSIQHMDIFTDHEKAVFKTAQELDQRWIIQHAADRTPYIDQAQSVNIFVPGNISKKRLHFLHYSAWKKGMKTLYYCRSTSMGSAEKIGNDYYDDECLACQ